jgi:hypothetical protein
VTLVVVLAVLGAALPSWGVFRVYWRARTDESARRLLEAERGGDLRPRAKDVDAILMGLHAPNSRLRIAVWDVVLVVLGLAFTALATIVGAEL